MPVSEKIVPNYRDIIKEPMDLHTMLEKSESDEYLNYAWVREMFELMVFNALTFNRYVSLTKRRVNWAHVYVFYCLERCSSFGLFCVLNTVHRCVARG